jgi:polar amino acid transport system substrate-binding protein
MTILKNMTRRAASVLLAAGLVAGLVPNAFALTPDEIKAKGTLVVGVLTDFPPFAGVDENQNPAGYDDDVALLLGEELGVKVELVPVTGPNRIPYLLTNRVDILVAALGINADRAKQVNFSNPYSALDVMVMAPAEREVKGPEDLPKYSVGVTRAGSQDTFLTRVAPEGTNIMRFEDDPTSLQALISGQVDVIAASSIHLAMLQRDHPHLNIERKFLLNSQGNGIGIRKEDTELLAYVNDFVARIIENGQLSEINQKWFGSPLGELPAMPKFD